MMPRLTCNFSNVQYKNMKFLIMDCPTERNANLYLQELKKENVTDIVRLCEPTYSKEMFASNDIEVTDMFIPDGGIPSAQTIDTFLNLCTSKFGVLGAESEPEAAIAVHCIAGLGRAPIMVCIALVEGGMPALDAVAYIRKCRRGALNAVQMEFMVDKYQPRSKSRGRFFQLFKRGSSPTSQRGSSPDSSSSGATSPQSSSLGSGLKRFSGFLNRNPSLVSTEAR
ncbi:protein-tyrosine phosphatase-like protein [Polychytrium aggregatum]|uniref:protein-tyrosine phosphatase-like protein n=1 Tax=Polychytrium aggregatum TaxID=110093 RepID=UPI0022FE14E0|nr:protein-tyrosine phosphatase-like protein [Polychytrium aggregatum]KAI9202561.1 protein-tyrosine phosphatase-like protein [Polychytrium aggregatum]